MAKLYKANDGIHKYIFEYEGKKWKFGAVNYEDYTTHRDPERKKRYIARHSKNENWNEINKGSLSRWILWNKPTIKASYEDFKKRFNIK